MSLTFPSADDVGRVVEVLLDKKVSFVECGAEPLGDGLHVACLVDDEGQVVGAIAADLAASIYLGGSLMMLPPGACKDQLKAGQPTEIVVEALTEVFNNIVTLVNKLADNPHVRVEEARRCNGSPENAWLQAPAVRVDLRAEFPGFEAGVLTMLGRPPEPEAVADGDEQPSSEDVDRDE
jgi:hypothetical protein